MKKIIALLLVLALACSFAACGSASKEETAPAEEETAAPAE